MNEHLTDAKLNDLAEGILPADELEGAQEHLRDCPACRARVEGLEELVGSLGRLPREAEPPRNLWPGIEDRLGARGSGPEVVSLRSGGGRPRTGMERRVSLSVGQLLAAGIALAAISGSAVWFAVSGGGASDPGFEAPVPGTIRTAGTRGAIADYEAASADLEEVLTEGRDVLKPETVRVLEENLRTIDGAIAEARDALARDPGSEVLYRLLAKNMRRKLDLLRSAAEAISAAS